MAAYRARRAGEAALLSRDCVVCAESKLPHEYPNQPPSSRCSHDVNACAECTQTSVMAAFRDNVGGGIACPECPQILSLDEVQTYMDPETFRRFERKTINDALASAAKIAWCPLGCGNGQVHAMGDQQPMVICQRCQGAFCHRHQTIWHHEHSCDEYDRFLADPRFRARAQVEQARLDAIETEAAELRRRCAAADDDWRRGLLRKGQEAERRRIEREAAERKRREDEARAQEAERRRLELEEQRRKAARSAEEKKGFQVAEATSVQCPNCQFSVSKIDGW